MKRYISALIVMAAMAMLGGCATAYSVHEHKDPRISSNLLYGTVRESETCGTLSGSFGRAFKYHSLTGPYRMVELWMTGVGSSFLSGVADNFAMQAYVPDGMPYLKKGALVLIRLGDTKVWSGFDSKITSPDSGMNNAVVAVTMPGQWWHGTGSEFANRPTVEYGKSPWLRMPWKDSVEHYDLHFTPFYKVDEKAGTCAQLRPYPNPGNPMYRGYPKWPARVDGK